jgi:hypothetical protein
VAVGTADRTFGDLFFYPSPAISTPHQHADVASFVAARVVKVENAHVAFATVHARMLEEVRQKATLVPFSVASLIDDPSLIVDVSIAQVVFTAIDSLTRPAIGAGPAVA